MSRRFNGSSYVKVTGHSIPVGTNARFLSAWVKVDNPATRQVVVCLNPPPGAFWFEVSGGATPKFAVAWHYAGVSGTTTVVADTWYHVAIHYSIGGGAKLVVNGTLEASGSPSPFSATGADLYLGAYDGTSGAGGTPLLPMTGELAEVVCGVNGLTNLASFGAYMNAGLPVLKWRDPSGTAAGYPTFIMPMRNGLNELLTPGALTITDVGSTQHTTHPRTMLAKSFAMRPRGGIP